MKCTFLIGTRPEIVKTFPVIDAAKQQSSIDIEVIHSGQHYDYELSRSFLEEFKIPDPVCYLKVGSGSHGTQTATIMMRLEQALEKSRPDTFIVQGDTNTALAGALTAAKMKIPVVHVEAGCRSFDWEMPEEINRIAVDAIASVCFAPSRIAQENLLYEGKDSNSVLMCGNTAVDACQHVLRTGTGPMDPAELGIRLLKKEEGFAVLTLHRSENVDYLDRLRGIVGALLHSPFNIVFPAHPRTVERLKEFNLLDDLSRSPRIHLIGPLAYSQFIGLLQSASAVLTDSGGIQVEAAILRKPCLTLRSTTEWPETVRAGVNTLVGTETENIERHLKILGRKCQMGLRMEPHANPFEGNAGTRIVKALVRLAAENRLRKNPLEMRKRGYPRAFLVRKKNSLRHTYATSISFDSQGFATTDQRLIEYGVTKRLMKLTIKPGT